MTGARLPLLYVCMVTHLISLALAKRDVKLSLGKLLWLQNDIICTKEEPSVALAEVFRYFGPNEL